MSFSQNQQLLTKSFIRITQRIDPNFQAYFDPPMWEYQHYQQMFVELLAIFAALSEDNKVKARNFWNSTISDQLQPALVEKFKWENEKDKPNGIE